MPAELVLAEPPLPRPIAPVTQVRSTLVVASLVALRGAGLEDRYQAQLSPALRERLPSLVSGTWLDVDVALAHYQALDGIGLSSIDLRALAAQVAAGLRGTVLSTISVLAKASQATPWLPLEQSPRLTARVWNGGGIQLWKLGPKEARLLFLGNALMTIPLVHDSMATTFTVFLEAFANKVYVRAEDRVPMENKCSLRIAWA